MIHRFDSKQRPARQGASSGLALASAALASVLMFGGQAQALSSEGKRAEASFELGPWRAYLVNEITPKLDRLARPSPAPVSWVQLDQMALAPAFAQSWMPSSSLMSGTGVRLAGLSDLWAIDVSQSLAVQGSSLVGAQQSRIEQAFVMPGLTTQVSERTAWTVSAVLATQRYVNPGMNLMAYQGAIPVAPKPVWHQTERMETVHGLGMRAAAEFVPFASMKVETAFRSRIDMNPLATLQGVHGTQAQLDIPSQFETALSWELTDRLGGFVGVSRIFYSEVGAFPSRAMPARFSALLGDSTSPEFTWRDLTVFSAGMDIALTEQLNFFVEYKNRAQPKPTSKALANALGNRSGKHAWRLGLTQWLGERMNLHFGAAYAPPEYVFGGHILGVVSDELKQGLEAQALWQVWF